MCLDKSALCAFFVHHMRILKLYCALLWHLSAFFLVPRESAFSAGQGLAAVNAHPQPPPPGSGARRCSECAQMHMNAQNVVHPGT